MMMRTMSERFLVRVEGFLASSGLKPSEFGRQSVGDPNFVLNLRRGRSPRLTTVDRVLAFMAEVEKGEARRRSGRKAG